MGKPTQFHLGPLKRGPKTYAKLKALRDLLQLEADSLDDMMSKSSKFLKQLHWLINARRARINALSDAKAPRFCTNMLSCDINCPPGIVENTPTRKLCRNSYFCPWCWTREVVGRLFDRMAWSLFGTTHLLGAVPRVPVDICVFERTDRYDLASIQPFDRNIEIRDGTRDFVYKELGPISLSAASLISSEPADIPGHVLTHTRIISLMVPGEYARTSAHEHGYILTKLIYPAITPFSFAEQIGLMGTYPTGLINGSLEETCQILNARVRPRKSKGEKRPPNLLEYYWRAEHYTKEHSVEKAAARVAKEIYCDQATGNDPGRVDPRTRSSGADNKRAGESCGRVSGEGITDETSGGVVGSA